MMSLAQIKFGPVKRRIDSAVLEHAKNFSMAPELARAVEYSLSSAGKRLRPILTLLMAESLDKPGFGEKAALKSALALEYLHTASLIADDSPCMDNDGLRRGKPTVHVAFGEATAQLTSYMLIGMSYDLLLQNLQEYTASTAASEEGVVAIRLVVDCLLRVTNGQYVDLFPIEKTLASWEHAVNLKTSPLFEAAFICGWIFGGAPASELPNVRKAALILGEAFQIVDDIDDASQDTTNESEINIVNLLGLPAAKARFFSLEAKFTAAFASLGLPSSRILDIMTILRDQVESAN